MSVDGVDIMLLVQLVSYIAFLHSLVGCLIAFYLFLHFDQFSDLK